MFYKITKKEAIELAKEIISLEFEARLSRMARRWSQAESKDFSREMKVSQLESTISILIRDGEAERLEIENSSLSDEIRKELIRMQEDGHNYCYDHLQEENPFILVYD